MPSYIITGKSININYRNKSYLVNKNNQNYSAIKNFLKEKNYKEAIKLINVAASINEFGKNLVKITERNTIDFKGVEINRKSINHIRRLIKNGEDVNIFAKFLNKLIQNPNKKIQEELYDFINSGKISITPDGNILAYKKVTHNNKGDLVDCYTKTIRNNVGDSPELPREKCESNRDLCNSGGLHFCSLDYLKHYSGDAIVIISIDPKDVVSIPVDYNFSKGRCCKYTVVAYHPFDEFVEVFTKPVMTVKEIQNLVKKEDKLAYYNMGKNKTPINKEKLSYIQKVYYNKGFHNKPFENV